MFNNSHVNKLYEMCKIFFLLAVFVSENVLMTLKSLI